MKIVFNQIIQLNIDSYGELSRKLRLSFLLLKSICYHRKEKNPALNRHFYEKQNSDKTILRFTHRSKKDAKKAV